MYDNFAGRVGRILSGSVNALIDAVENAAPEMVMEQAIREIDGAIDEVRAELGKVIANKHLMNTRLMDENRKHEELSGKIEVAIGEGREDLAQAAIGQQLDIEAQIPVLERSIADAGDKEKELEGYVQALQAKKREMREELRQFADSRQEAAVAAVGGGQRAAAGGTESTVEKAVSAFDRVMEKNTGVGGAGMASRGDASKLAELDELARKNRIQERLNQLKSKAGGA